MSLKLDHNTWQENPKDVIVIANRSTHNYILDLPAGRYRLDAGRRMRTLKSIMDIPHIRQLFDQGVLVVEND